MKAMQHVLHRSPEADMQLTRTGKARGGASAPEHGAEHEAVLICDAPKCVHADAAEGCTRRSLLAATGATALTLGIGGCGGGDTPNGGAPPAGANPDPASPPPPATTPPAPTIASIAPAGGPAGTQVVISGSGFAADATAATGETAAAVSFVSATELRAVVGSSNRRGAVDVRVAQHSGSVTLQRSFWMTTSGLPGNEPSIAEAGVPSAIRNEVIHAPELVSPEYGYQPWLTMIAPRAGAGAAAFVDYLELAVRFSNGTERLVTRDDFGIELPMRSGAWGELLWRVPWGASSGYREQYLYLAPSSNPTMLVLDQARAPAGQADAVYFHSWTRDWEFDPLTGADIGRACIPFAVPPGSQLVLRAAFRSQGRALFQIGLDRYSTRTSRSPVEVALSDYHRNETAAWKVVSLVVDARS